VRAEDDVPTGIPDPSIATSLPAALADPLGARRDLAARGITGGANYIDELFGVVSGGLNRDWHYDGRLELYADADLEKLMGLPGLVFHINAYQIHGSSISAESLGSLKPASYLEATPATRLFEVWLEQSLFEGVVTVRAGQLAADSEFIVSEGAAAFLNGSWGWPSIAADNLINGGPAFPLAAPGVRVAYKPADNLSVIAAVFNGDVVDDCPPDADPQRCNSNGFDFPFGDGALVMLEGAYKYKQAAGQLPGTIKVGGWYHSASFTDQRDPDLLRDGNHAIYAIIDQRLFDLPGSGRNVAMFARVIASPSDRNQIDFYAEGGITITGPWPSRPTDLLGIGYAYSNISDDARSFDRDQGLSVIRDYEAVLEVNYTADILPGFTLQPNVQHFWNPGGNVPDADGTRAVANALVLGIRSTLNY
jgi:porin